MAGAAFISAAALQCSGKLSVGEVDPSANGGTGSTGATGSFSSGFGTTGTASSGSTGSAGTSVYFFDAGVPYPSEYDSGPYDSGPSFVPESTTPDSADVACWENQLPPEDQPILPTATVSASCMAASTITQWSPPVADAGPTDGADGRAWIVGQWLACSAGDTTFSSAPSVGIEFGGNGRWRLLVADSGAIVPTTTTDGGYIGGINDAGVADNAGTQGGYWALANGQLEWFDDGSSNFYQLDTLALSPDGNALQVTANPALATAVSYFARTSPAANNGDDNVPTTTDGTCSLVGTWNLAMTSQSPAATFSFDALGNFVGGALGADLCASHTMYGTYLLSAGIFQLTENIGLGSCASGAGAGYRAAFDATCTQLTLQLSWDHCGGRGYFDGTTILTKQ